MLKLRKEAAQSGPLANTPQSAFQKAQREFFELHGSPKVESSRWFVAFIVAMGFNAAQTVTLINLLPLKTLVPVMVEVRENTGVVGKVVAANQYTPTAAMVKAAVYEWTRRAWSLNSATTREDLKKAQQMVRGTGVSQFRAFLAAEKPFERVVNQPQLARTVEGINVDTSKEGVAFVFFSTVERIGATGDPVIKRWRMTLNYTTVPPETEKELLENPSGLVITLMDYAQDLR